MKKLNFKVGDIALFNDRLIIIQQIDFAEVITKQRVGGSWFKPVYEDVKSKHLSAVWWSEIGDYTGMITSSSNSHHLNWRERVLYATILLKQATIILPQLKNKQTDVASITENSENESEDVQEPASGVQHS